MGITQYEGEADAPYSHRILYSALSCWIKAASMDRPITGSASSALGVSRRHVHDRCSAVLAELLQVCPSCKMWFETDDDAESPVALLRGRLLRHGDLVNVGFDTNVALSAPTYVQLTHSLRCIKGYALQAGTAYSGLANIALTPYQEDFLPTPITDARTWLKGYMENAWWRNTEGWDEAVQYFNPYKNSRNNHTCWQTALPRTTGNIVLARRTVNKNSYEYLLYQPEDMLFHRIDPVLQEFGAHRRFMIGIRAVCENPVPAQIARYSDHVTLKLRVRLPAREGGLLESYAWPHNSIADRLEWDMPLTVWEYIKPHMEGLGLEIEEEASWTNMESKVLMTR